MPKNAINGSKMSKISCKPYISRFSQTFGGILALFPFTHVTLVFNKVPKTGIFRPKNAQKYNKWPINGQ